MENKIENLIICPHCRSQLQKKQRSLHCLRCKNKYQIKNGIPALNPAEQKYTEIPLAQFKTIIAEIKKNGWEKTIYKHFYQQNNWLYKIITNPSRSNIQYLLPIQDKIILDIGAGWGQLTFPIAQRAKQVVALEGTLERALILKTRAQKEKRTNVFPICADALRLPFKKNVFDITLMIGVLEWIPCSAQGNPEKLQIKALKEMRRVLKPGGLLCLAIENSHALKYRLGEPDDHTGLVGITYLSRKKANNLAMKKTGFPYRTYTYNKKGLSGILKKAGFKLDKLQFFYPYPDYKQTKAILPLDAPETLRYFYKNIFKPQNFLAQKIKTAELKAIKSNILPDIVSAYLILAQK